MSRRNRCSGMTETTWSASPFIPWSLSTSARSMRSTRRRTSPTPGPTSIGLDLELNGRQQDGTELPVKVCLSPIDTGGVLLVITATDDVTERQRTLENAQRMTAIVENSNDAIIAKTLDGIISSWNRSSERMYGYSSEEIIGKSIEVLCPNERTGEIETILAKIRAGQHIEHLQTIRIRKDGTALPVSLTVSPIRDADGAIIGASTTTHDVTQSRQAIESGRSMIESSLDSLVAISPQGMITDVNEATVKVTGIPRAELIGTAFSDCFTEPEKANAIYQLVFERGMAVDYPLTMRHRDGTLTEVRYNAAVYRDTGENVLGVFAAARDVTELKHAAETARSLAVAEDLVRTVMGSASIGIALADLDGSFRVVNRSLCDLLGYDEAYVLAHRLSDFAHPDDVEGTLQVRAREIAGSIDKSTAKLRLVRADGATVWVRQVGVMISDGDGQPNLIMVQVEDITSEHEAHEALAYQAFHDPLTGLRNRAWILDILAVDLRVAKRLGTSVGALFVDLDNFKVVNDSLGHAAGDKVLVNVANR